MSSKLYQIWIGCLNKYLQWKKLVPVRTDYIKAFFWICKVIEGKEEEMVLQSFLLLLDSAGKKLKCKILGIVPKASPTENILSV